MADKGDNGKGATDEETEALQRLLRRLGGLFGQAKGLFEEAEKSAASRERPRVRSSVTVRTLDGSEFSLPSVLDALKRASEGEESAQEGRLLRQFDLEFGIDTPGRLVAVADLPGATAEDVSILIDGDLMVVTALSPTVEYWAEVLLPRDVTTAKRAVSMANGILSIVWTFPEAEQ